MDMHEQIRNMVWIIAGVGLVVGVGWLWRERTIGREQPMFQPYTSTALDVLMAFEYPAGWKMKTEQGKIERYKQIRISGPRNADDTYSCYVAIRTLPLASTGGAFTTADELLAHYAQALSQDASVKHTTSATRVFGLPAKESTLSQVIPALHTPKLKPLPIPVTTQRVAFVREPYLVEITYSADTREFERNSAAMKRLLKTIRIL